MDASGDRGERIAGPLRFFSLGFVSLILQTVLARESLFVFHGGEIGLGLFYAVWLGAIATGAGIGANYAGRARAWAGRSDGLFLAGLVLLAWLGLVELALFRHHRAYFSVLAGAYLPAGSYLLLLLAAVAPGGMLTGFLFPVGLSRGSMPAGSAYAVESFGSMAGGALASLYALPRAGPVELLAWAGLAALLLLPFPLGRTPGRRVSAGPAMLLLALLALLLASGFAGRLDRRWTAARWRHLGTGTDIVADASTPYHQLTLARRQGEISLYLDGLYQGGLLDPYVDSLAAALMATQHPDPRRMLVLAPGRFGPARVLTDVGRASVTLVRADESIDRIAQDAANALPGRSGPDAAHACGDASRVQVHTADPRAFVRSLARSAAPERPAFDLIAVLHGGPSQGAGNRLFTQEFFADCANLLSADGVFATRLPGAANVPSPELSAMRAAVLAALQAVFRDVRISPGMTHYVFAALPADRPRSTASPLTWDADSLAARRSRLWPAETPWPAGIFAMEWPAQRRISLETEIAQELAAGAHANRDAHPFVYYEEIRRWDRFSGSRLAPLLELWRGHPWRSSLGLLGMLALVAVWVRRSQGQALVSLASTGMVGMGADLTLLLLYQTFRGTLYLEIGLVVAVYMTGLGLGAWLGERLRRWGSRARAVALTDWIWTAFLLSWIPLIRLLPACGNRSATLVLLLLALCAGLLTALPFPWVARRIGGDGPGEVTVRTGGAGDCGDARASGVCGRAIARAGGMADAADHAGAVWGAIVTGVFLVPLLGFAGAIVTLAGVKVLSALGWLLPPARQRREDPSPDSASEPPGRRSA
ncbi:MAG: hypothetical protein V1774_10545 [Candidatus Eisenbacteria bacterium]